MTEQESRERIVAQQMRLDADYGDFVDIPREQVMNTLTTARRFVAAMKTAIDAAGHK